MDSDLSREGGGWLINFGQPAGTPLSNDLLDGGCSIIGWMLPRKCGLGSKAEAEKKKKKLRQILKTLCWRLSADLIPAVCSFLNGCLSSTPQ